MGTCCATDKVTQIPAKPEGGLHAKSKIEMEYHQQAYQRYGRATKQQKAAILDEFMDNCGYKNRKY